MSLEVLKALTKKADEIPGNLQPAIKGSVACTQRNYRELTNIRRSPKFFYAEGKVNDLQRTVFQRAFLLYVAHGFANKVAGSLIEQELRSWFDLKSHLEGPPVWTPSDIWAEAEKCSALLSKVHRAWGNFDIPDTRKNLIQLRETIDGMLRSVNQMPDMGK